MAQIYLDCDGVLADFEKGAQALLGMPSRRFEREHGAGAFWKRLAGVPDFFGSLDLMPDATELFEAVKHTRPIILTGLPEGPWAAPQKVRWAARHFPGVEMITTMAALKREHCHPGDVLVDDTSAYVRDWEAEGGIFILHRNARDSIAELKAGGFL